MSEETLKPDPTIELTKRQQAAADARANRGTSSVEERARSAKSESLRLSRSRIMTQLAAANNPAHRTMLESALKSINDEMGREGPKPRPREEVKLLEVSASEFEQLSAKTAEILEAAAVAYKRIAIDQEEIEQLKTETRALLAGLRAA